MTRAFLPVLLLLPAILPADTAPFGALRSSTPVVTNESDTAFLSWRTNAPAILLGTGASNRAGGDEIPWYTRDISIGNASESCESVSVGAMSTSAVYSVAIGPDTYSGPMSAAVGSGARSANNAVAIGYRALAAATGSIQIGEGRNDERGTVRVGGYTLLDSRGIIPAARLGSAPMRARLCSGRGCTASADVHLYWFTNAVQTAPGGFPVGADLPDDSDAMQWDLWLTAGEFGFWPSRIVGVTWVGPCGPPDASAVAPGETLMLRCTAVRLPGGAVAVLAEYRATVGITASGVVPLPARVPGRLRVKAVSGSIVPADGTADVYTLSLSSSVSFGALPAFPDGVDGLDYELWISNVGTGAITPVCGNTLLGSMPSIPAGGTCVLRCRSVRAGIGSSTVVTVEGVSPSMGSLSAGLVSPSPDAASVGEGLAEGDER